MFLKKFLTIGFVAAVLVACGDNGSSNPVTDSDEDSSSSVCVDCDGSSSSKVKSCSSVKSSSSERSGGDPYSSSSANFSSAKSSSSVLSSSSKKDDAETSSSGKSSSGGTSSSSENSSSSKDVEFIETSSSSEKSSSSDGSSSSSAQSSSSSVASSSSILVEYVDPSTVVKGTMTDERDGQTYKTVTIGTQTWMAENLNYAYTGVPYNYQDYGPFAPDSFSTSDSTSWCYDNDNCSKCFCDIPSDCYKYGRLYTWAAAMDSVGSWTASGKECGLGKTCLPTYPVRGICPEGWHLPATTDWNMLIAAVGGLSKANTMLRSKGDWFRSASGSDAYSFAALPAGYRYEYGFKSDSSDANFWSSSEYDSKYAYRFSLYYGNNYAELYLGSKYNGLSVRCVKDE